MSIISHCSDEKFISEVYRTIVAQKKYKMIKLSNYFNVKKYTANLQIRHIKKNYLIAIKIGIAIYTTVLIPLNYILIYVNLVNKKNSQISRR